MKNDYRIDGEITVIFIKRRNGDVFETMVSTESLPKLLKNNCTWCIVPTRYPDVYYVQNSKRQYLHRFITDAPVGMVVDHINHDTLNNALENLRVVSNSENIANSYKRDKKGRLIKRRKNHDLERGCIYFHKNKRRWIARITENGRRKQIGHFKTEDKAIDALRSYLNQQSAS